MAVNAQVAMPARCPQLPEERNWPWQGGQFYPYFSHCNPNVFDL